MLANHKNRNERILLFSIILLCVLYFTIGLIFKPIISNDALYGMVSLHNYLNGADWNKVLRFSPAENNITSGELTWWAPGQYALPYWLSKLFSISIGRAITILEFASVSAGSYFYYKLLKLSGMRKTIILVSILVLLSQRFINIYFIQYNSSDLFLFFYTPFYSWCYFYLLQNYDQKAIFKLLLLLPVNLLGLFIKNSFLVFELAFNLFLFAEAFLGFGIVLKKNSSKSISLFSRLSIILPFFVAVLLSYYFFLRLGEIPANGIRFVLTFTSMIKGIFVPAMEVLFASLSLSGIFGNFYKILDFPIWLENLFCVLALSIIGYIIYTKRKHATFLFKGNRLFRAVLVISIVYIVCWFYFSVRPSSVSAEDRLFLPATMLIFPFILDWIWARRSKVKYVYMAVIVLSAGYGILSFASRIKKYSIDGSVPSKGLQLNGFKVFAGDKYPNTELDSISNLISKKLSDYYVIVLKPDIVFRLQIRNRLIVPEHSLTIKINRTAFQKEKYVILSEMGKNKPLGLIKLYKTKSYELYKSY